MTATTGANLDSFGHNATIPQILAQERLRLVRLPAARAGTRRRSRARSSGGSRPTARACSPTGSRTSTARRRTTSASTSSRRSRRCRRPATSTPSSTASATTAAGRRSRTSSRSGALGEPLEPSSLRRFFDALERRRLADGPRRAPAPRARLLHDALGHQALEPPRREPAAARREVERDRRLARRAGLPARAARRDAWKLLLFNQFHDTLAGTSIEPAYDDARDQIGQASSIAATPSTRRSSRSRARSRSSTRTRCGRSSSSTRIRGALRTDVEIEYTWTARGGPPRRRRRRRAGADAADAAADDDEQHARAPRLPGRGAAARLPRLPRPAGRGRGRAPAAPTRGSRTTTSCSSSTRRRAGSRGSSSRRPAPTWPRPTRRTRSSSTTRATRGATRSRRTTRRSASSSASRRS